MNVTPIAFHSEEYRLVGDLYAPDDLQPGERRAGIVLCHGYTGVKDLYVPDNARVLTEAGYIVLAFDYKGWGESEGPRTRLAPYSRVADVQAPSPSSERRMRWTHPGSTPTARATAGRRWCGPARSTDGSGAS